MKLLLLLLFSFSAHAVVKDSVTISGNIHHSFDEQTVEFKTKTAIYTIPRVYFLDHKIHPGKKFKIKVPYLLVNSFLKRQLFFNCNIWYKASVGGARQADASDLGTPSNPQVATLPHEATCAINKEAGNVCVCVQAC